MKLKEYLENLNKYEEEVIFGILQHIKNNKEVTILRLRTNGIDCIKPNGLELDKIKEQLKHWNAEFIEIKDYE